MTINSDTITAQKNLDHARTMLAMAESAWDGGVGDYATVQKWQAETVLWGRVIENAEAGPVDTNERRRGEDR